LTGVISKTSGDLVLTGAVSNASGGTSPPTIVVTKANLTSFAIYGANPAYTVTVGTDNNKVVEKVIADYFAGLNFGLIGSTAPNPNNPGHTIGSSPFWTWYGNQPNGGGPKPPPLSGAFYANNHYGLNRSVSFPGFDQSVGSGYGGETVEVFGEAGWRIAVAAPMVSAASVEPFLGVAGVDLHSASFAETPGPASLVGGSENTGYGITMLGLRGDTTMFATTPLTLTGMIGWQQRLRWGHAERDIRFRKRSLDSVLDRRGADRARRARPRIWRRPAPDLEHQARRLLFGAPVIERQRQRRQSQA
jgi:Autotransporter beta-domain